MGTLSFLPFSTKLEMRANLREDSKNGVCFWTKMLKGFNPRVVFASQEHQFDPGHVYLSKSVRNQKNPIKHGLSRH